MEIEKEGGNKRLEAFEKDFEKKIETFEHHIKRLNKIIEEKDGKVVSLEHKLEELVMKFESFVIETKKEKDIKEEEINKKIREL